MTAARVTSTATIRRRRSVRSTTTPRPPPSSSHGRPWTAVTAATAAGERVSCAASSGNAASRTPSPKSARNPDSQYRANGVRSPAAKVATPASCRSPAGLQPRVRRTRLGRAPAEGRLLLGLLGDEADVPRQDDAAAGELPHVADVQPGADDGTEEAGQGLVVEADPAAAARSRRPSRGWPSRRGRSQARTAAFAQRTRWSG